MKMQSCISNGWKSVRWKANEVQSMIKCECPCKACTRRRLGCHENCVKYKIYRELYYRDKRKKRIYFAMHSDMLEKISKRVIHKTKYRLMKTKAGN